MTPVSLPHVAAMTLTALVMATGPARADDRPVVVELFTSQGCASCPPADALMERLNGDSGIIALSYNVDIWDYLGWPDSLARPEHTARQRLYARRMPQNLVYTPQAVIGGMEDLVGSREGSMAEAIARVRSARPGGPDIMIVTEGGRILIRVGEAPAGAPASADLLFGTVTHRVAIDIGGGENSGRSITYTNVVRTLTPLASWTGAALEVSPPGPPPPGADRLLAILQIENQGPILAATMVAAPGAVRAGQ